MHLLSVLPSQQMAVFHDDSSWLVSAPDNKADHSPVTALAAARPGGSFLSHQAVGVPLPTIPLFVFVFVEVSL